MPSMDDTGAYVPWRVRTSTTAEKVMTFSQAGDAMDLTGYTIVAGVRSSESVLDTGADLFTFTVTYPSGQSTGVVNIKHQITEAVGAYYWYLQMQEPDGDQFAIMHGPFVIDDWPTV